jgi:hypothetical protein
MIETVAIVALATVVVSLSSPRVRDVRGAVPEMRGGCRMTMLGAEFFPIAAQPEETMNRTSISWVHNPHPIAGQGFTWNHMSGCKAVSPGCLHVYAVTLTARKVGP